MTMLETAIAFATERHAGQKRKAPDGAPALPYIVHPLDVMSRLVRAGITDEVTLAAAVLHDVVEDCGVTWATLGGAFGVEVADVVVEVSDPADLSKSAAKKRQVQIAPSLSARAKLVKLADKTANVADVITHPPGWKPGSILGYTEGAMQVVTALGPTHLLLEREFHSAYQLVRELHAVGALR